MISVKEKCFPDTVEKQQNRLLVRGTAKIGPGTMAMEFRGGGVRLDSTPKTTRKSGDL